MKKENKNKYDRASYLIFRVYKEYINPNKINFLLAVFFMLIVAGSTSYRAYLIKPAIDKVFISKDMKSLIFIPIKIIIIAIISCIATYIQGILMNITNNKIVLSLQEKLFSKLIYNDMNFFQKQSAARISGYFGDIFGISEIINLTLNGLILQFFTLLSLIALMFYQNFKLSLLSFIFFPTVIWPLIKIGRKMRNLANKNRSIALNNSSLINEVFENIQIIKSNNKEEKEIKKINEAFEGLFKINLKMVKRSLMVSPLMEMASTIGFAAVILYGGFSVVKGTSTAGEFFLFMAAALSAYKPMKSFGGLNVKFQNAIACARRFFIVIDKDNHIKEKENCINLKKVNGDISFDNVTFYYPYTDFSVEYILESNNQILDIKPALSKLNLNIKSGKSYALVGHSGSGKSTIFKLLLRFYDVTSGKILIDGNDIKDLSFKTLRDNISLVSQDVRLFDDTIYNNIKYSKENATKEEIEYAAKMANVEEFVKDMENGYDTKVGPNGSLLSGGQKQRISIARALLKNSPILLLDEATSALDPISEELIQNSLKILMKNKTTIIIAHRLSTITNCNHIFVFENGRLVEEGNHKELLSLNKVYKNLCDKQFNSKIKENYEE